MGVQVSTNYLEKKCQELRIYLLLYTITLWYLKHGVVLVWQPHHLAYTVGRKGGYLYEEPNTSQKP